MKHRQAIKALEKKIQPKQGGILFAWHEDDGTLTITNGPDKGTNYTFEQIDEKYPNAMIFYGGRDLPLMYV